MNTLKSRPRTASLRFRALRCGVAVAAVASIVAACGDDAGNRNSDKLAEELIKQAATAPSDDATAGTATITIPRGDGSTGPNGDGSLPAQGDAAAPPETHNIDKTVWWGGFKITVSSAEGSSNALSATINLSVSFQNLTSDVKRLDRNDIVLTVGTQSYLSGVARTPEVPANSRNDAVLDFLVGDTFVFDHAMLTFGRPDTNQAVLPFGAAAATSFEPKVLQVAATLTTPVETIRLTGGTIDASYASGEKGTYIVRVPLQATYTAGGAGGDLLLPNQFALSSPTGSSVVGLPVGPGDVVAEPVYTGQDVTGKAIAFKVKSIDAGTWTITYTDSAGKSATADFTVG